MSFPVIVKASTREMRERKEKPVSKEVIFPSSIRELKDGIGPWKSIQEMFEDALSHRVVVIQSKMRQALESGNGDSEEDQGEHTFSEE